MSNSMFKPFKPWWLVNFMGWRFEPLQAMRDAGLFFHAMLKGNQEEKSQGCPAPFKHAQTLFKRFNFKQRPLSLGFSVQGCQGLVDSTSFAHPCKELCLGCAT